jgi:hypothetical protein
VNGGCGFVGIPHPSHPFTMPHPMVYKTSQATWKNLPKDEISSKDANLMFAI